MDYENYNYSIGNFKPYDLEIIKKESSLNKADAWAKDLEKQIFVQQEYLQDREQHILNLSKTIDEMDIKI